MRDLNEYAQEQLVQHLIGKRATADDLTDEIDGADHNFDFDSYAPYRCQEDDILTDYDGDYWREAEELADGGQEFKPSEWAAAKRHYVSCLAYAAFSAMFEAAKTELSERISDFADFLETTYNLQEPVITVSRSCPHGWASHTRELEDGTMLFEAGQLDGCNGACVEVGGCWLSASWMPKVAVSPISMTA